jgi:hypothetical protein
LAIFSGTEKINIPELNFIGRLLKNKAMSSFFSGLLE